MQKIWLKNYPAQVPAEVNTQSFSSLLDMFLTSVKQYADRPAAECMGTSFTYTQLYEKSRQFAAYLQSIGLKKGDRFAIMMPNCLQYLVALYGAFMAGLIIVNVNPLYSERELAYQLQDAGAKAILVFANVANTLAKVVPQLNFSQIIVTELGDLHSWPKSWIINFIIKKIKKAVPAFHFQKSISFTKAMQLGAKKNWQPVELTQNDLAFLQYTGGTTGVAKGAMLSHGNMVANVEQAFFWMKHYFKLGHERVAVLLPLYHIFSLLANALVFMRAGSLNVLVPNPRDTDAVIETFQKHRFTVLMGVNTLFNNLLAKESFRALDFSELHIIIAGGMALQKAVAERWYQVTKTPIREGFGLTEASPITCINPMNIFAYNGSIGLPIPSTEVKIVDEEKNELPLGEVGEFCVRGPQVMQGYWHKPEETAKVLSADGWLYTGDMARVDEEGFVHIVDRKKDMIAVAGFNVYPNEVENIIAQHPQVKEVAVIGVPHPVTGEAVKAFVVCHSEGLTKAELMAFCRQQLVSYKVPRRIEFCTELPKNNVGKVLRRLLREKETTT